MKVLCLPRAGELVLRDMPVPKAGAGEALVKIEYCGICGSDVTAFRGVNPTQTYPIDGIGHEGVGIIEEIGANDKGIKRGDRVALEPYVPCNRCPMCKAGRFNNCENLRVAGVHKNGMMAEYFVHPVQLLYKIPDSLSFERAALTEPQTIGLHALSRSRVQAGENVVIFGAGAIGLLAAFSAKNIGARPVLIDFLQERLEKARELGIENVFNSKNGEIHEHLRAIFGSLPQAMLDCTGSPAVIADMHNMVAHGGRISLVGWPHDPVTINTIRCMQKELDLYPCRNSNGKFPQSLALIEAGKIPADNIITKVVSLEETQAVIEDMVQNPVNYIKVLVKI
jgi:2-desacetyl-2-hydroxyethyl bacteriochlorophyllide A dehydrogenase